MSNGETDKDKDVYIIRFSEVLSITKPIESVQAQLVKDCSKKFQWPFYLKTEKRNFELYAPSELERQIWMAGFDYILKCGKAIKKILSERDAKQKEKEALDIRILNENCKPKTKKRNY